MLLSCLSFLKRISAPTICRHRFAGCQFKLQQFTFCHARGNVVADSASMDLKSELLKSIWYAFTALDVEKSGKVSKSQLKVLSHNLYTALNIPHDPVSLEEHFRDDDDGPVSNQGYMPYLNKYILAKAKEGTFDKETFDDLCWMMTSKKNYKPSSDNGFISRKEAFKLWCLFNFLSENRYPLVMIPEEVEYLIKKMFSALSLEWDRKDLDDFYAENPELMNGISVWKFLELMESRRLFKSVTSESVSLAVDEVFQEIYHDILKKGYMWKKGQVRRNWNERWFVLKPSSISYYVSEDMKEKKGEIKLDNSCTVESIPDKDGRRCLFCIKTVNRTFEISASDMKQRVEWMQAIQTSLRLLSEGKTSYQKELKLRRIKLREQSVKDKEDLQLLRELQEEKERQIQEIENLKKKQQEAEALRREEEEREWELQKETQLALQKQLLEAEKTRAIMAAEIAQREQESERQRLRIKELETTQRSLEMALDVEIQARLEEERARVEQARLIEEEQEKLTQLRLLQEEQQALLNQTQKEKQEIHHIVTEQANALENASQELKKLQESKQKNDQNLEEATKKLRKASRHVTHWSVQLNRLKQPVGPGSNTVSGGAHHKDLPLPGATGAFSSNEFIVKQQFKKTGQKSQEDQSSDTLHEWAVLLSSDEDEKVQEQLKKVTMSEASRTM
ncbi:differentially expressed in FDCP 6 homolog [Erpetoichthys calabaricus]|uniref:Switch-associated protein 70 n=1 Tax=Erpetoichthys calabaricus TaxID=27687 RepID=A0A8C4S9T5_ERPCA|nr:differentially expressed in FDCP 6 homolog [Erpetoichthys calabaricus]